MVPVAVLELDIVVADIAQSGEELSSLQIKYVL